jgi:predicted RNase H-like HicB family nuclease
VNPKHYSMLIQWDGEDNIYIISVPELKVKTHGKTYEEAIKNALEVIELWIEVAMQDERSVPLPREYAA